VATISVAICAYFSLASSLIQLYVLTATSLVQFGLIAWVLLSKHFETLTIGRVAISVIVMSFVGLFAAPMLEDDHFRYLWDGYMTATTGRPYQYPPSHYFDIGNLSAQFQIILNGINNPDIGTVYGPLLQAIFALCYFIAPGELWPLKVLLAISLMQIIFVLGHSKVPAKWLFAFCLHPLLIKESILTAHPDLLIGCLILNAVLMWRKGYFQVAAIIIACAAAVKITAAALLMFFCFDQRGKFFWPAFWAGSLAFVIGYLPMMIEHFSGAASALGTFGQQWVFNPIFFRVFAYFFSDAVARILVVLVFGGVVLYMLRMQSKQAQIHRSIIGTLVAMLLLAPVLNPWYWLWLLPILTLVTLECSTIAWLCASASLMAYAHVLGGNHYVVPLWATVVQMVAVIVGSLALWRGESTVTKVRAGANAPDANAI
jgi:alpha-1,6-mannosyltransferase